MPSWSILGGGSTTMRCRECGHTFVIEPSMAEGLLETHECAGCKKDTEHIALPDFPGEDEALEFNRSFMPKVTEMEPERRRAFLHEAVRRLFGLKEQKHLDKFMEELKTPAPNLWRH